MKPLISKAKLMQEIVDTYDVEAGQQVSVVKLYNMVRAQPEENPDTGYWLPSMDGDGVYCSSCGSDCDLWSFDAYAYCPRCGSYQLNYNDFHRDDRGYWRAD